MRNKMKEIGKRVAVFLTKVPPMLCLPFSAVLMALCLMIPQLGPIQWFCMIPALWYLLGRFQKERIPLRRAYGLGFLYYIVFFLIIWHWFIDLYPMEFAVISKLEAVGLIAICWIGLSLLQASLAALSFPVFAALLRTRPLQRVSILTPFLFASVYTVAEWAQTLTWSGVPWARLALGQSQCGVLFHSVSLFGSYFLTFAIVAVNALAAYAILHLDRARRVALLCAAVFGLNLAAGMIGYFTAPVGQGEGVVVAAVQGNVGSANKWTADNTKQSYAVYEKYTAEAVARGAEIVVFPETFMPYRITENTDLGQYVSALAVTHGVTIRCGGFYYADDNVYNGIFTVYPNGEISDTVYAKRRLVPFGEFVPWRPVIEFLIPPLADMNILSDDLAPGTDSVVVETSAGLAGTLICFDSIYENLTLDAVQNGAEYICLSTNDSWFLDSIGVYMHHRQACLRAVESGRYIVRSADTGISSMIAPDGRSYEVLPPLVEGVSVGTIYPTTHRTLYSYIGNTMVYLLIAAELLLAADGVIILVKARKRKNEA